MHEIHHQMEVNLINWISRLRLNAREILKGWSPLTPGPVMLILPMFPPRLLISFLSDEPDKWADKALATRRRPLKAQIANCCIVITWLCYFSIVCRHQSWGVGNIRR